MTQKIIAFQLPEELYDALQTSAQRNFRSVSAELRFIVSSYIANNNSDIEEKNESRNDEVGRTDQ